MAWDDDKNNKKNDPWGKKDRNGPPDLDEILKNFIKKLSKWLGKGSLGHTIVSNSNKNNNTIAVISGVVVGIIFIIWLLSGLFIVGPAEQAVITRLGKYNRTIDSGLHWIPILLEKNYIIDVNNVSNFSYSASMLTKDENIVSIALAVQYRVGDPKDYLFGVVNPVESIQQATASALRQVIGSTTLDDVLTTGREAVRKHVYDQLKQILALYKTGLILTDVAIQPVKPPEEVKESFDDAIKAQEDEQRFINQAEAYARHVVPIAEGQAKGLLQEAEAYRQERILIAQGDVSVFESLLPAYKKFPKVTKERLYLEVMTDILSKTNKLLVDVDGGNNMIYLPIDKFLSNRLNINESRDKDKYEVNTNLLGQNTSDINNKSDRTSENKDSYDDYKDNYDKTSDKDTEEGA